MANAETLIHAFMTSRLDYCNALLGGCSARLINKLKMVQNAAARVLTRTRKYDHISPDLSAYICLFDYKDIRVDFCGAVLDCYCMSSMI